MDVSPCRAPSALDRRDVHVWMAALGQRASVPHTLESTLSRSERTRADGFRLARHRTQYVFGCAVLRDTLARYVGLGPERLEFQLNSFGKPFLPPDVAGPRPYFNMSHSEGLILIAITADRPVGVDVERIRAFADMDSITHQWFAPQERDWVVAAPAGGKERAFYTYWSRKEAYIKARGVGLSMPLNSFDTSAASGIVQPTAAGGDDSGIESWTVADLTVPEGFVGALAVEGGAVRRCTRVTSPLNSP